MTVGWVDIVVDGEPAQVRICYTRAWHDPEWCRVNGVVPPAERRSAAAKRGAAKRKAKREGA